MALQRLEGFRISAHSDTALGRRKKCGTPAKSRSQMGTRVVCAVAARSLVLKEFRSPEHCLHTPWDIT